MDRIKTRKIIPVQAPCFIAYKDPLVNYFWLRPYVDMGLKHKIWGIALNGQVFRLVHEEDGDWDQAPKFEENRNKLPAIPSTTVIDIASYYRREFDATVELLQSLGIKAEPWRNGLYWTSEEDGDNATVLNMRKGSFEFRPKDTYNIYIRLVSNYIVKKPDIMDYPLAYLIDGHLEIANDYHPELRDKLWGLHVAKSYVCMKLSYEPEKMTVTDGLALGKSLSGEALRIDLPKTDYVDGIGREKDGINNTLAKLAAYGAKVDLIYSKDLFWLTNSLYDKKWFVTYGNRMIPVEEAALCRLFGKNKGKTVII